MRTKPFRPPRRHEIDAILRQADEYAKTGQVLEREQLREMLMHLISKAAGD